ncbi:hypothetical protein Tco_0127689 [Tanacetum coccineum]
MPSQPPSPSRPPPAAHHLHIHGTAIARRHPRLYGRTTPHHRSTTNTSTPSTVRHLHPTFTAATTRFTPPPSSSTTPADAHHPTSNATTSPPRHRHLHAITTAVAAAAKETTTQPLFIPSLDGLFCRS